MKVRVLLPLVGAVCGFSGLAHADLKWTETMSFSGGQASQMPAGMGITTTNWAKKEAMRTDTAMKMGPIAMDSAEISHCDTKEKFTLDPDLQMYATEAFAMDAMPAMPSGGMPGMPGGQDNGKPGKGTAAMEFSLKDLGKETIAGIVTEHYSVTTKSTLTGCAGNGTTETSMETWVAPIHMPSPCQQPDFKSTIGNAMRFKSACDVTTTFKGDTAAMTKAFGGFIMKMKIGGKDGGFTKEVTMLSQAELDDTPFTIPAGYKKVTEDELQKAKSRAMMKKMMGGMGDVGKMMGNGGGDDNN